MKRLLSKTFIGVCLLASLVLFASPLSVSAQSIVANGNTGTSTSGSNSPQGSGTVSKNTANPRPRVLVLSIGRTCADPNALIGTGTSDVSPASTFITGFIFQLSKNINGQQVILGFGYHYDGYFSFVTPNFGAGVNFKPITLPLTALTVKWSTWYAGSQFLDQGVMTINALNCSKGNGSGSPVVAMASDASSRGYWLLNKKGQVFAFGNASWYGSAPNGAGTFTGIAATPNGGGYWLVTSAGRVLAYGDAAVAARTSGAAEPDISSDAANPAAASASKVTEGIAADRAIAKTAGKYTAYWTITNTGGVYNYGGAPFLGSPQHSHVSLEEPITAITSMNTGAGYWLLEENSQVFAYGKAKTYPMTNKQKLVGSFVAIAANTSGTGYWTTETSSSITAYSTTTYVYNYGSARYYGEPIDFQSMPGVTGLAATSDGQGYWVVTQNGVIAFGNAPRFVN
jgi:hypothetical protein